MVGDCDVMMGRSSVWTYSSLLRSCKFSKTKTVTEHVQYFKNRVCACSVAGFVSAEFARSQQTAVMHVSKALIVIIWNWNRKVQ